MKLKFVEILTIQIVAFLLLATVAVFPIHALTTRIYLDPSTSTYDATTTPVGTQFNVTVWTQDAVDVAAWQVYLEFNDSVLRVTRWFEPTTDPQYIFAGKTTSPNPVPPNPGYVHLGPNSGRIEVASNLFPTTQPSSSGTGKLCILEFNITAVPTVPGTNFTSALDINNVDTFLLDPNINEIPSSKESGSFEISLPTAPVTMFTLTIESVIGGTTIPAAGTYTYPEGENVTVQAFNSSGFEFDHWKLDGANYGTLNPVNVTMDGNHTLTPVFRALGNLGDVNGDGKVDIRDVYAVALAFGTTPTHPRWNIKCDVNNDGKIDLLDYYIVCANFGKFYF